MQQHIKSKIVFKKKQKRLKSRSLLKPMEKQRTGIVLAEDQFILSSPNFKLVSIYQSQVSCAASSRGLQNNNVINSRQTSRHVTLEGK